MLVPVTLTLKLPLVVPETVRTELPDVLIVLVLSVAVIPAEACVVRVTVPLNPFCGVTVMVQFPDCPAVKVIEAGEHEMVNVGVATLTVIVAVVCCTTPLVPVTVIV